MKRLLALIILIFIVLSLFSSCGKEEVKAPVEEATPPTIYRGVWVASVYNLNFPSRPDLSKEELTAQIDEIVQTATECGLNSIFFQVHGSGDALYSSAYYPVSKWLSTDGTLTLDCLDYMCKKAHENNIEVHAWFNPLRASLFSTDLPPKSEYCVEYNGAKYYDCGIPALRDFVAESVTEIVKKYDVDGIIFDDYFYPYPDSKNTDFGDDNTYNKYCDSEIEKADWRRENVNSLVKSVYDGIKKYDKNVQFGISPFGIWKNGSGEEDGSLTFGLESYNTLYCDTLAWVNGGYVDYIAPQLYWDSTFETLAHWWEERISDTDVGLAFSHAAYRYDNDWEDPEGIMTSEIDVAETVTNYRGSIFYAYEAIKNNVHGIADEIKNYYITED